MHTTLSSSKTTRSTMLSVSGRKDTHQLQKVVKYPNTMPTTCSRFTGLKRFRSSRICSSTSAQCRMMVALPISMPQMQVMA